MTEDFGRIKFILLGMRLCATLIWIDPERENENESVEARQQRLIEIREYEQRMRRRQRVLNRRRLNRLNRRRAKCSVKNVVRQISSWSTNLNRHQQGSIAVELCESKADNLPGCTFNNTELDESQFGPASTSQPEITSISEFNSVRALDLD